jgi:hypothetical protein
MIKSKYYAYILKALRPLLYLLSSILHLMKKSCPSTSRSPHKLRGFNNISEDIGAIFVPLWSFSDNLL